MNWSTFNRYGTIVMEAFSLGTPGLPPPRARHHLRIWEKTVGYSWKPYIATRWHWVAGKVRDREGWGNLILWPIIPFAMDPQTFSAFLFIRGKGTSRVLQRQRTNIRYSTDDDDARSYWAPASKLYWGLSSQTGISTHRQRS